jgi:hypothetical protein
MKAARLSERGSILVEAMVASLILAAMLGVMFESMQSGARQIAAVDGRRMAMLVAQSQMAGVGVLTVAATGQTEGRDAGMGWKMRIVPLAPANRVGRLVDVRVMVNDLRSGQQLANLHSVRLVR